MRPSLPVRQASRARMAEELPGVKGVEALPSWAVASCACGSAALGAVLTQPFDVVKTRLQVGPCRPPSAPPCTCDRALTRLPR